MFEKLILPIDFSVLRSGIRKYSEWHQQLFFVGLHKVPYGAKQSALFLQKLEKQSRKLRINGEPVIKLIILYFNNRWTIVNHSRLLPPEFRLFKKVWYFLMIMFRIWYQKRNRVDLKDTSENISTIKQKQDFHRDIFNI